MSNTRIERDSMGQLNVPEAALYGAQTQRAVINFPISHQRMPGQFIRALILAKAAAARANVELGAQIIDINMGCPAKKVCNKAAGSALLKDEVLVNEILQAVVAAVDVPVTLKIRTGWDRDNKNGLTVAKIAEQARLVHRGRRVRHHRRNQAGGVDPGVCQRRHRFTPQGPACAQRHRR